MRSHAIHIHSVRIKLLHGGAICQMVNEARIIQVNDINIGANIAKLRKEKGYKQTEIVAILQLSGYDISTFSYNRIEKGTQNPTVSLLIHLCEIFSCDMNTLFAVERKND